MAMGRFSASNSTLDIEVDGDSASANPYEASFQAALAKLAEASAAALQRKESAGEVSLTFKLRAQPSGRFALVTDPDTAHIVVKLAISPQPEMAAAEGLEALPDAPRVNR